jgi:hypothetical protein
VRPVAAIIVLAACAGDDSGPVQVAGEYDVETSDDGCGVFPDARLLYVSEHPDGGIWITKRCQYGSPDCTPALLQTPMSDAIGWSTQGGWALLSERICALHFSASSATFDRVGLIFEARSYSSAGVSFPECTAAYAIQVGSAMQLRCATRIVATRK